MMQTIQELADELGVSRPTIYNNKPDNMDYVKVDGVNYIDDDLKKVIADKIESRKKSKSKAKSDSADIPNDYQQIINLLNEKDARIQDLKEQNETLKGQIKILNDKATSSDELLRNQQILTLRYSEKVEQLETDLYNEEEQNKQNNYQSESHSEPNPEQVDESQPSNPNKQKGFFNKLFGK